MNNLGRRPVQVGKVYLTWTVIGKGKRFQDQSRGAFELDVET